MSEFPEGWEVATLRELSEDISYGFTTSATSENDMPRLLRITDLQNNSVDWENVPYCSDKPDQQFDLKNDDIVVARTGATTGKNYLISKIPGRTVYASYLIRIRTAEGAEPAYISQFMKSPEYWAHITKVSKGVAQPGANAAVLGELHVPLPPQAEQQRIVKKLDTLSARTTTARTHLSAIAKLVERYRAGVLGQIFGDLHWRSDELRELTSLVTSGSRGWAKYYAEEGPLFIRVGDTRRGTPVLDLSEAQHVQPPADGEGRRTKLKTGDLVVSITADLGRVGVVPAGVEEAYVNQHIALVRPNDAESSEFIAWYLISPPGQKQLFENDRGATRAGLGLDDIRDVRVPRFTKEEQRETVRRIKSAFAKIDRLSAEAEKALKLTERLDQRILAKAFAGELVHQDPNDEPASVLLTRIRETRASATKHKRARRKKVTP